MQVKSLKRLGISIAVLIGVVGFFYYIIIQFLGMQAANAIKSLTYKTMESIERVIPKSNSNERKNESKEEK